MARPTRPVTPARRPKAQKKPMSPRAAQFIAIAVALGFIAIIVAIVVSSTNRSDATDALPEIPAEEAGELLRDDPHLLTEATPETAEVVLVEFLDFQCPGCASASPFVQQLAADYGDRLSVVVRHLPLTEIHPNAVAAALAAEAAAAQGQFAAMYERLFETQPEWGRSAGDQSGTFRGFAEELGLDLGEYDRVVSDAATLERIALDRADAFALGAGGTPSFFLDGEFLQLSSFEELRVLVEARLG